MALTISNEASANSIVSAATLDLTVTAAVGTLLVLAVAADNYGTSGVASMTTGAASDSAGNQWINHGLTNYSPGGVAGDGVTLGIWTCMVGAALVAGTVTISFSPNTPSRCATIQKVTPGAGEMIMIGAVGAGGSGSGTTWTSPAISVTSGHTIFGFTAMEAVSRAIVDSDTTNGSWSARYDVQATTGVTDTSQSITTQYKTVNATGDQTFNSGTGGSARDYAFNTLILYPLTITFAAAGAAAVSGIATATGNATFSAAGVAAVSPLATATANATFAAAGAVAAAPLATATANATFKAKLRARFWPQNAEPDQPAPGATRSIRIMVEVLWPDDSFDRLWDGAGPVVDISGNLWRGCVLNEGLDEIEQAINGEAATMSLSLTGVASEFADYAYRHLEDDNVIGGRVRLMIQPCGADDQPIGDREVLFTGTIDDILFDDSVAENRALSTITIECTNRFTLRRLTSGQVLSDTDQKARSAAINPGGNPDRFCEDVPLMQDRTIPWPKWG